VESAELGDTVSTSVTVSLRQRIWRPAFGLGGLLLLALLWQLVSVLLKSTVFPSFVTSLRGAGEIVTSSVLTVDIFPSIERTLLGFVLSSVVGVTTGVLIGRSATAREYTSAVIDFARSLPTPLLVPAAMVVFGLNGRMVVAVIVTAATWPVLINTINGTANIDPTMIDTAHAYGLSGRRLFLRIVLPAASPQIFAGLRVALSISLVVMVVAEMLGGGSGIGYFIVNAEQSFNIKGSYGGVIVLGVIGWLFDTAFLVFERRLLAWQRATSGRATRV
jgi:ABC-type nitrate/sulfonate/bicarbonate transport system permease component